MKLSRLGKKNMNGKSKNWFLELEGNYLKCDKIYAENPEIVPSKMLLNENASNLRSNEIKNEKKSFAFYKRNVPFNDSKSLDEPKQNNQTNILVPPGNPHLSLDDQNGFKMLNRVKKDISRLANKEANFEGRLRSTIPKVHSGSGLIFPTMHSLNKLFPDSKLINFNLAEAARPIFFDPAKNELRISFLNESSFTRKYLARLQKFLANVFTYQPVCTEDLHCLSPGEKKVLCNVINGKDYHFKGLLVESLYSARPDVAVWNNFYKSKRKEEHLKYGLKILLKHLQSRMIRRREGTGAGGNADSLSSQLRFYVHYFGQLKFSMNTEQLAETIDNRLVSQYSIWIKLAEFILPEMGQQSNYSSVKSINQTYLRSICRSSLFVKDALSALLDSAIFMGYCRDQTWEARSDQFIPMETIGVEFLKTVGATNKNQIKKLFKEWENQLVRQESYVDTACPTSIKRSFEIIKSSAKRKNLKFPWTFTEMHNSLVECFLALLPFTHPRNGQNSKIPLRPSNISRRRPPAIDQQTKVQDQGQILQPN